MSGTIKENILYSRDNISKERLIEICKICQIHDDIMNIKDNYDALIGENGIGLSEGQLQRIAVARALVGTEQILLLDEVTSALDNETEQLILEALSSLKDKIIFVISHKTLPNTFVDQVIKI